MEGVDLKIYIAGPMTGIKDHNFPEFNFAARCLRREGHEVINPAELDAGESLLHPWDYYLRRDLKKLVECDTIAFLEGWQKSKGALLEKHVASALGLKAFYLEYDGTMDFMRLMEFNSVPANKTESVLEEAQRLVGGDRGASYGHPIEDFTRTGKIWGAILGTGDVPPDKVALCMVGVKISREVNSPKRDNRVDGPGYFLCLDMVRSKLEAK